MPTLRTDDLARWTDGAWRHEPARTVSGVSIDTRTLRSGDLYVAIRGPRFDGHEFLAQAFEAGALAAVVEEGSSCADESGLAVLSVKDTKQALTRIAVGHRETIHPLVVGITGSVGKTTVKELIADALSTAGSVARTRGNWNNDIGLPLSLLTMEAESRYGVFEVGMNHPGELAPLCEVLRPAWGVMTPVGAAHSEAFDSLEAIAEEKAELFRSLPESGGAVVSHDAAWYEVFRSAASCPITTVSMVGGADYVAEALSPESFLVREAGTGDGARFDLSLSGRFMIENALLAIALGRRLGLDWPSLRKSLRSYSPLSMRWQHMSVAGLEVVNDAYNANPLSMRAALEAFAGEGARWLVLAGMYELGTRSEEEHMALGREVARGDWAGLVTVGELGAVIARGAEEGGAYAGAVRVCQTHEEAADYLRSHAGSGDHVLLKGSRGERLEGVLEVLERVGNQQ